MLPGGPRIPYDAISSTFNFFFGPNSLLGLGEGWAENFLELLIVNSYCLILPS